MPLPNEHSCVLTPVSRYDRFRRGTREHEGKDYSIVFGRVKGEGNWEQHSFRYAKDAWSADRKSTRLNSSHGSISYPVCCLKKKKYPSHAALTHAAAATRHGTHVRHTSL